MVGRVKRITVAINVLCFHRTNVKRQYHNSGKIASASVLTTSVQAILRRHHCGVYSHLTCCITV